MPDRRRARLGFLLVAVIFGATCLAWIDRIPFDQTPDEWTHYYYNVRVMLDEHRIPRVGVDDMSAYETAHAAPTGRLVARYSYAQFAPVPYLLYAAGALAGSHAGVDRITSARLVSLACGLGFLWFVWATARRLGARAGAATAVTAAAGLVPQVQFVSAYINQEAFSLLAAAAVTWALARDAFHRTRASWTVLALTAGLVLVSKVNFWVLLAGVAAYGLFRISRLASWGDRLQHALVAFVAAGLVAGPWLARNAILYGSVTGQDYVLALMRSTQQVVVEPSLGWASMVDLWRRGFVGTSFRSALMTFDYMGLLIDVPYVYGAAGVVLALTAVACVLVAWRARTPVVLAVGAALGSLWVVSLALHAYNSIVFDYQPQGRYLFSMLAPTAAAVAWLASRSRPLLGLVTLVAVMMAGLTAGAHGAVARGYKPFNRPTVVAVRRATSLQTRITLAQDDVVLDRAGVRALSVEFAVLPQYDLTFVGMDLTDAATGALIRRAYVVPWEWRSIRKPWFRFAALTTPPGRVRMTLFTEWPGVHPSLLRADCQRPSIDAGLHLCVEAHE